MIRFFALLITLIFFSCDKQKIKFHEACNFKTLNNKEVLVCDERMLKKVKSINAENKECEKFEYILIINGKEIKNQGIKCKTDYGYEVIR